MSESPMTDEEFEATCRGQTERKLEATVRYWRMAVRTLGADYDRRRAERDSARRWARRWKAAANLHKYLGFEDQHYLGNQMRQMCKRAGRAEREVARLTAERDSALARLSESRVGRLEVVAEAARAAQRRPDIREQWALSDALAALDQEDANSQAAADDITPAEMAALDQEGSK